MPTRLTRPLQQLTAHQVQRRWRSLAKAAPDVDLDALAVQAKGARALRSTLDDLLREAENRLSLPRIGADSFIRPLDADWAWRPDLFRGPLARPGLASVRTQSEINPELKVFHDCPSHELTIRQLRNTREEDLAPFGLRLDVFEFTGSFLSFSLALPASVAEGLSKRHLISMKALLYAEHPLEIFARLNLQHGPNTETIVRQLPTGASEAVVEFDLGYLDFNEARVSKLWLDLIFEAPRMNQVTLRDLTFSRQPRAQM